MANDKDLPGPAEHRAKIATENIQSLESLDNNKRGILLSITILFA